MTTPPVLTAAQLNNLSSILNNPNLTQGQQIVDYYQTLASYGYAYGNLALGVVNNSTLSGQIANNYIQDYANANGITYNSTIAANIQYDLAQADLAARTLANGADLNGRQIENYHQLVFQNDDPGLPIQAWTGYVPYELLGENGWQQELSGTTGQGLVYAQIEYMSGDLSFYLSNSNQAIEGAQWLASINQAILQTPTFQQALTSVLPPIIYDAANFTAANAASAASILANTDLALIDYCTIDNPTGTGAAPSFMANLAYEGVLYTNNLSVSNPNTSQLAAATNYLDVIGNTTVQNGNINITLNSSTNSASSLSILQNGNAICDVGQNTFDFSFANLQSINTLLTPGFLLNLDPSSSTGLSQSVDMTASGASVLNGGNVVATAPSGSTVTDNASGTETYTSTPASGVTETTTVAANGAVSEFLNDTTNPFSLTQGVDPSTGLLIPTQFDIDSINWTPTTTSLDTYVTQATNTVDTTDQSTAQSATQSTITSDVNDVTSGNASTIPVALQSIVDPLISDADSDQSEEQAALQDASQNQNVSYDTSVTFDNAVLDPGSDTIEGSSGSDTGSDAYDPDYDDNYDDDDGDYNDDPLVFSTTQQGINLLSLSQSNASFDFTGTGATPLHTGWVGAGTDLIVETTSSGISLPTFSSLSALDSNHDGVINVSDPGFSQLSVWNDANGNGVVDPGELETLTQAGIASISLTATPVTVDVGGNLITEEGMLIFTNGTTEVLDQVSFASQGKMNLTGQSAEALSVIKTIASDVEAKTVGTANAAADAISGILAPLLAANSVLVTTASQAKPTVYYNDANLNGLTKVGFALNASQVNIVTAAEQLDVYDMGTYPNAYANWQINVSFSDAGINAPAAAEQSEQAVVTALTAVQTAAQQVAKAASAQILSDNTAVLADVASVAIGSTIDTNAVTAANSSEALWQSAFADIVSATSALQSATNTVVGDQGTVNSALLTGPSATAAYNAALADENTASNDSTSRKSVPLGLWTLHTGTEYATTQDALEATYSFLDQQDATEALAGGEAVLQTLLPAVAQAWNASTIVIANNGTNLNATGNNLLVAAAGTESFTDSAIPNTYIVLPNAHVTISNFLAGVGGSSIDFLSSGAGATIANVSNGVQITVGSSSVTLVNTSVSSLSLSDNLLGIGSLNIAGLSNQTALVNPATLADIGASQIRTIYGVTAANALAIAGQTFNVAVSDTTANILANLSALQTVASDNQLVSITATDNSTLNFSLTPTQLVNDGTGLGKITNAYNLGITGVAVSQVASVTSNTHVNSIAVTDTAADIDTAAGLSSLESLAVAGKLTSTTLTNTTTPTLTLNMAEATGDAAALAKISSAYKVAIVDISANINTASNLAALQAMVSAGTLASIAFTDSTTPTLAVTAAELTNDAGALALITSAYNLSVTGATAAQVTTFASNTHVTAIFVSDSAANVSASANLAALQTVAAAGKLGTITLTDSTTPTLSLTAAQLTGDASALNQIASSYNVAVTGAIASQATSLAVNSHVTSISIADTAADVSTAANLAALQTLATAGKLGAIILTDSSTPTLSLTATQFTADTTAIGKITSAYNLSLTSASVAQALSLSGNAQVTSIVISDSSANIIANLAALETLATGSKLGSISLTDAGTPTLSLTAAQLTADATLLNKITGTYNIAVSGVTAANAASVAGQAHVTSVTISDTAANVTANIAALQTLTASGKLNAITLTDSSVPTLVLTAGQITSDIATLNKITSSYGVAVSDTQANETADASAIGALAASGHLVSFVTGSDTLNFTNQSLTSLSYNSSTGAFNYGLASAAPGYTESVSWNPTTGKAILNITGSNGNSFASSLGYINPGYVLSASGSVITNYNASGQALNTTEVFANGSQADISYNLSGGNSKDSIYYYNAAGAQTELRWDNNDGTAVADFYDVLHGGTFLAQQIVNSDTSGSVTANGTTIQYAAGDVVSVAIGSNSDALVTVNANAGKAATETFDLTGTGITASINGNTFTSSLTGSQVAIDASGDATLTTPLGGFGSSTAVLNASGISSFSVGRDTISFASGALQSLSYNSNAGAFTYGIASAASGFGESVTWNPTTGKAILNITGPNGSSFASSLGYINPGYVLSVSGSSITNYNASGQALNTTQVNANGSQNDISYNVGSGGTWTDNVYDYNSTGGLTEIRWDNNDTSSSATFYNPTSGAVLATESINASGNGTVSWPSSSNSISFTPVSGSQQIVAGTSANTINISGTGTDSLTGFSSNDILDFTNISFGANTTLGFTENSNNTYGTLTLSDGTHNAVIQLMGQYMASGFNKVSDSGAGTLVSYIPPANQAAVLAAAH